MMSATSSKRPDDSLTSPGFFDIFFDNKNDKKDDSKDNDTSTVLPDFDLENDDLDDDLDDDFDNDNLKDDDDFEVSPPPRIVIPSTTLSIVKITATKCTACRPLGNGTVNTNNGLRKLYSY